MDMNVKVIEKEWVKEKLPYRNDDAYKGSVGTLVCVCGSFGMAGAAILSIKAALRSGIGMVRAFIPECIYPIAASCVHEAVFTPVKENVYGTVSPGYVEKILEAAQKSEALLLGPGLGLNEDTIELTELLLQKVPVPVLLDADGLNALSRKKHLLINHGSPLVLTPHLGEMSRISGIHINEIQKEPLASCEALVRDSDSLVLVLKGHNTIVYDSDSNIFMNKTGNSGMAVGGSGDVLAGVIASLLAQGMDPLGASAAGVFIHGRAGDIAAEKLSKASMLPSDIIENLPGVFKELQ